MESTLRRQSRRQFGVLAKYWPPKNEQGGRERIARLFCDDLAI